MRLRPTGSPRIRRNLSAGLRRAAASFSGAVGGAASIRGPSAREGRCPSVRWLGVLCSARRVHADGDTPRRVSSPPPRVSDSPRSASRLVSEPPVSGRPIRPSTQAASAELGRALGQARPGAAATLTPSARCPAFDCAKPIRESRGLQAAPRFPAAALPNEPREAVRVARNRLTSSINARPCELLKSELESSTTVSGASDRYRTWWQAN